MKRYVVALVACTVLGVGGYALVTSRGRATETATAAANAGVAEDSSAKGYGQDSIANQDVAALAQQVAVLRAEVTALRQRDTVAPASSVAAQPGGEMDASAPIGPADVERQKQAWHARMADIEASFHSEARDPGWAAETASTVQQVFASDETLRGLLRGVECRSQTCRLELTDEGPEPVSQMLPPLLVQLARQLPQARADHVTEANGSKKLVLYMSRPSEES